MKRILLIAVITVALLPLRAYSQDVFWENFNKKLEIEMQSRLIFNLEDLFQAPYFTHLDDSYSIKDQKSLKRVESVIKDSSKNSVLFALEKEWDRRGSEFLDDWRQARFGTNKKTREINLEISSLRRRLDNVREDRRVVGTKIQRELEKKIRTKQDQLAKRGLIGFGLDTSLNIEKLSEWDASLEPFVEKSLGSTINKASFIYLTHRDVEKIRLETLLLLPQNIDLSINSTRNLTRGWWESGIEAKRWINRNLLVNTEHGYEWDNQRYQSSLGVTWLAVSNFRINLRNSYDWKNQEYSGQAMFRYDF